MDLDEKDGGATDIKSILNDLSGRLPRQVREPPKEWQNNRLPGWIFFISLNSWICTNLGPLLRSAHNGYRSISRSPRNESSI